MKVQILSDIHLEFLNGFEFPQTAPILALLGDIGNPGKRSYVDFLQRQADRFDKVFVVCGNHECYGRSVPEAYNLIQDICNHRPNLIFLNQTVYDLDDDHVVLGTTLWSRVLDHQQHSVSRNVNDFRAIRHWSVDSNNCQHEVERAWLQQAIRDVEDQERLAIVFTHHCPSFKGTSAPRYYDSPISSVFCTDLQHLLKLPVILYGAGHSHWCFDITTEEGCRLVSNQKGYPGEQTGFKPGFNVVIDTL